MLQTSIYEFIDANPAATMNDLKMHFSDYDSLNDIELYNVRIPKHLKKIKPFKNNQKKLHFIILLLVVLAFIIYIVLYVKSYIDVQNSIDA